jgi:hypothetical protein
LLCKWRGHDDENCRLTDMYGCRRCWREVWP